MILPNGKLSSWVGLRSVLIGVFTTRKIKRALYAGVSWCLTGQWQGICLLLLLELLSRSICKKQSHRQVRSIFIGACFRAPRAPQGCCSHQLVPPLPTTAKNRWSHPFSLHFGFSVVVCSAEDSAGLVGSFSDLLRFLMTIRTEMFPIDRVVLGQHSRIAGQVANRSWGASNNWD